MLDKLARRIRDGQPVKVALYGDSISEFRPEAPYFGGASTAGNNWGRRVVDGLQARFPQSEFSIADFAIGGHNSYEGCGRVRWLIAMRPDLVLLAFGANDCGWHEIPPKSTEAALLRIVEELTFQLPEIDIVISCTGGDNPVAPLMAHLDQTIAATQAAAGASGLAFVDIRSAILRATDNGARWTDYHNGRQDCHPNDAGHEVWAAAMLEVIDKTIPQAAVAATNESDR